MDSDDDLDCPLCMEELDIADRNFRPCPCGYQVNRNSKCGMFLTVKKKKSYEFHVYLIFIDLSILLASY